MLGPTVFLSGAVVVKHLPLPEDLERGIACNVEARGQLVFRGGIHLGQRNRRGAPAQLFGSLFVLWCQTFTVSTPTKVNTQRLVSPASLNNKIYTCICVLTMGRRTPPG